MERTGYDAFLQLNLTENEFDKTKKFLENHVRNYTPFNHKSFYVNYFPLTCCYKEVDEKGKAVTCSEFVWLTLENIGFAPNGYKYYKIKPQQMYEILYKDEVLLDSGMVQYANVSQVVNYSEEK